MNEQITSAAELDALPPRTLAENEHTLIRKTEEGWQTLSAFSGSFWWDSEAIAMQGPWTVLYRPDQPQRVQPSREDIADTLIQARSSGMCHFGKVCDLCDCGLEGHTDDEARRADARTLIEAEAVLALFAQQPTVSEVKAEALREAALAIGHSDNCWPDADRDPYVGCKCRMSLVWAYADRIEREARP